MLRLTGILDGESVEDQLVSADKLISAFKIPFKNGSAVFELDKSSNGVITVNKADGKERFGSRTIQCTTQGTFKGESYFIRYYENAVRNPNNDEMVYTPKKIHFKGKQMAVDLERQKELAVILYLSKMCGDSPFKTSQNVSHYRLVDHHANATAKLNYQKALQAIRQQIISDDDITSMRIAKGIRVKGASIPYDHTFTGIEAKAALLQLASVDPANFAEAYNNRQTLIAGIAREAIDNRKVQTKSIGAGNYMWMYVESGMEICRVTPGSDQFTTLVQHISDPGIFQSFAKAVGAIDAVGETKAGEYVENVAADNLVDQAIKAGVVIYDSRSNKVYLGQNFQYDENSRALLSLKDGEDWREALHSLGQVQMNRLKKAMEENH